jgi:hypothetical protein
MAALAGYFKSQRDPEQARKARELKLLAEARLGELIATLGSSQGTRTDLYAPRVEVAGKLETIKSAGISQQDASIYERLAQLPKDELAKAATEGKTAREMVRPKAASNSAGRPKSDAAPLTPRESKRAACRPPQPPQHVEPLEEGESAKLEPADENPTDWIKRCLISRLTTRKLFEFNDNILTELNYEEFYRAFLKATESVIDNAEFVWEHDEDGHEHCYFGDIYVAHVWLEPELIERDGYYPSQWFYNVYDVNGHWDSSEVNSFDTVEEAKAAAEEDACALLCIESESCVSRKDQTPAQFVRNAICKTRKAISDGGLMKVEGDEDDRPIFAIANRDVRR